MNKYLKLIFIFAVTLTASTSVQAASLDELYREIVRNDNQGYLPVFVKNRNQPELLFANELQAQIKPAEVVQNPTTSKEVINLLNTRKIKEQADRNTVKKWQDTIQAVKENRVTPIEIAEIDRRISQKDAAAIEILAWMNARGIGVKQDLVKAFNLYNRAAELGVSDATKNAALVYRSMSRVQRDSLSELNR